MTRPCFLVLLCGTVLCAGCTPTPTSPSVWTPDDVRAQVVATNLDHVTTGARGRLTRWRVPIEVNTNGIARAAEAIDRVERWSGGVIRFARVNRAPATGLSFVEGGARVADGRATCVQLANAPPPADPNAFTLQWDGGHAIVGTYTIHLGSGDCNDVTEGRYAQAYAEHVLGHALGVFDHFTGYTGVEGLADGHAFAVLYNLYANPIGATAADLVMWPAVAR